MRKWSTVIRINLIAVPVSALCLGAGVAQASALNTWTAYGSMASCKSDALNLNNFCFGLLDGQALGLVNPNTAADALAQSLGLHNDDEGQLPAPASWANPVREVWNNTNNDVFVSPDTLANAAVAHGHVYMIPPHRDEVGSLIYGYEAQNQYSVHQPYYPTGNGWSNDNYLNEYADQ